MRDNFKGRSIGLGVDWGAKSKPHVIPTPESAADKRKKQRKNCAHLGDYEGNVDFGCCHEISQVFWCNLFEGHVTKHSLRETWDSITTVSGKEKRVGEHNACYDCKLYRQTNVINNILFQPIPKQRLPDVHSNKAIVTVATNAESRQELSVTGPLFRAYAQRHGADYIELYNVPQQEHPAGHKYAITQVAARYEQTLYVDCDIVVMLDSPSIFDIVPMKSWGLHDEYPYLKQDHGIVFQYEWDKIADQTGMPRQIIRKEYNCGLMVMPQSATEVYVPPSVPVLNVWCTEQHWTNLQLLYKHATIHDLPPVWHAGWPGKNWPKEIETAHFIHMNGSKHPARMEFLKHFATGKRNLPDRLVQLAKEATWQPHWIRS
jgi:hypothetical protein